MLRAITKTAFACAYALSRPSTSTCELPFIVGYHRVVEDFERSAVNSIPSLLITTRMLEHHIDWLAKHFDLISLDEIGRRLEAGRPFRRPAAAITFDDGYSDVYRNAFPLLKRKGIPAGFFVVTEVVGTQRMQIYDKLYLLLSRLHARTPEQEDPFHATTRLLTTRSQTEVREIVQSLEERMPIEKEVADEMAPLTWPMISEMQRSGFTIGSHTANHTLLTQESLERAQTQLTESRRVLEDRLKISINHFAYPDGRFNPAVVQAVNAAGYRYAYGICRARDSRFPLLTIPRKVLWERACLNALGRFSPSVMSCHANWAFDGDKPCGHDHTN